MKRMFFVLAIAACNTSSEPFELDHPQILAVRSEPAHAPAGGTVRVDALVGDSYGNVRIVVPDTLDAAGLVADRRADGWYVTAPASAPEITVTVDIDGEAWTASKQLVFGDTAGNPTVAAMQVDGSPTDAIALARGEKPALDLVTTGVEPLTYAWYTSVGKLVHYRSAEAELDADIAGDGVVCVVVRDARGGVAWQLLPASIE